MQRLSSCLLAAVVLAVLPATAGAVLPGNNGHIVFASGRGAPPGDDSQAKLFLWHSPRSAAEGDGIVGPLSLAGAVQHRHPTWLPDRTKIAYARVVPGSLAAGSFDIYILDLTSPAAVPTPFTNAADNVTSDRPAWSPDGTRIAFENEVGDNTGQRDIIVRTVDGSAPDFNLTDTPAVFEGKPAWTPGAQEIYYHLGEPSTEDSRIVKEPAGGGAVTDITTAGDPKEFQPSVSPDGTKLCFTRGTGFNTTALIVTSLANGGAQQPIASNAAGAGNFNCTWSPNGAQIAYVQGTFTNGTLVRAEPASPLAFDIAAEPAHFDGNPDWAPDGPPVCPDAAVTTTVNTPVTFDVECTDTGPEYERSTVRDFSATDPAHGTVDQPLAGDPYTYTPDQGFTGTDSFQVRSFDAVGFGGDVGTVAIVVRPAAGGGGGDGGGADVTAASITDLVVSPRRWRRGSRLPAIARAPVGTTISFRLDEAASVTLSFRRARPGRRVGGRCVKPTRANRTRRRCTRFVAAGSMAPFAGRAGLNEVRFEGRLSPTRRLRIGRHRVRAGAVDAAGNRSTPRRAGFRIVRR